MKGWDLGSGGVTSSRGRRHSGNLLRVRDGLQVFLAEGVFSTESAHPSLRVLQHGPRLASPLREEVKCLHVETGDVDTHPQIAEAELLEAANPPTELLPRHPLAISFGEDGTCNDALHREALGRGLRFLNPAFLQLEELALAVLVLRFRFDQLQVEKIDLTTKRRGAFAACGFHAQDPGQGLSLARRGQYPYRMQAAKHALHWDSLQTRPVTHSTSPPHDRLQGDRPGRGEHRKNEGPGTTGGVLQKFQALTSERRTGFEPATPSLGSSCSTN